jgi:endonuclease YncB( thermonuclease family)
MESSILRNQQVFQRTARPRFQVVNGDTVKFGPQLVHLFGIDAPQKGQTCDGGKWLPGPLSTKALIDFIAGRPVVCNQVNYDTKNNSPMALCFAGGDDLQALMVSLGWAWADTRFSDQYVDAERRAAAKGLGVHAHRCPPPREWSGQRRQQLE